MWGGENKMFKYMTKELSQDSFICWCINWFNYKDQVKGDKRKENLCKMSEKILDKILENTDINSSFVNKIDIFRQFKKIDILLIINTKSSTQYVVTIEDKVGTSLNKNQWDLYVPKLIQYLEDNPENQEILSLERFEKDKIIPVFWKTGLWNEEKEKLKNKLSSNIGKKVVCINGIDTLELLKDYVTDSEIVEDYYTCLQEYLKINNQLEDNENSVNKILENGKLKEGTTFSKNYYVYNCFSNLIGRQYNSKSHTRKGGIVLRNLSKRLIEEEILKTSNMLKKENNRSNIVSVDTITFSKGSKTGYKNSLGLNGTLWYEEVCQEKVDKNKFYTNLRYIFLFAKNLNTFTEKQYKFLGLFKLIDYDEKNKLRLWEKQELSNNTIQLDEEEIIKVIKNIENK